MAHLISKTLLALGIAMAAPALCAAPAAPDTKKPAKAKPKTNGKSKAKKVDDDSGAPVPSTPETEPDVTNNKVVQFNCELGNVVTVYNNEADTSSIALRWKKRLHRLSRVGTTTGAQRFENPNFGLVWIGIPSKGMLLDSKLNRQLANECKNAEQENPLMMAEGAKTEPTPLIAPMGRLSLRLRLTAAKTDLSPLVVEGRKLLVPVVAINALYRWSGGELKDSSSFLVGRGEAEGGKMAPFRLDRGARSWSGLAARLHSSGLQR